MAKNSNEVVTLTLPDDFVGQLLDGIEVLIDEWDYTYRYLAHGIMEEDQLIRECHSETEAASIRDYYRRIATEIANQLAKQRMRPSPND